MNNFINNLLNNYPNSTSLQHYKNSFNNDWYPFASIKFGYSLCPNCDYYKGELYNNKNNIYYCKYCICFFNICKNCNSYCVVNQKFNNRAYNKLYKYLNINLSLIKIIYKYSLFEPLYCKENSNKLKFKCRRCNKN